MASNLLERCTTLDPDGLPFYNQFTNVFDEMGTGNLANHDFKETFDRVTDERGRFSYVNLSNQTNFTANLIGEIGSKQEGTWMAAYPKKNPPNLPYNDDHSAHRMVIAARCPTGATEEMKRLWKNFLASVDQVCDSDQEEEDASESREKFKVYEWTGCEDDDKNQPANLIYLRLKPTYEKPFSNARAPPHRVRNTKDAEGDVDMDGAEGNSGGSSRKVGDTYSPDLLTDHKGPYFAHEKAKLVQRQYKDEDGILIAPHEVYEKLTEGTLFSAQISLHTYIMKDPNPKYLRSKIYHIMVDKLLVLDRGNGNVWKPDIPSLPTPQPTTPKGKRTRGALHSQTINELQSKYRT
ncbi:hypothetical protein C8J57DRAFT_1249197 [Mycena rebaudengoi]|nr:hypothetical protein C8J57DRAFT_1249197 [Mycena rebaudengoi]